MFGSGLFHLDVSNQLYYMSAEFNLYFELAKPSQAMLSVHHPSPYFHIDCFSPLSSSLHSFSVLVCSPR